MTATPATNPRPTATETHPTRVRPRDPAYRSRSQSRPQDNHQNTTGATNLGAIDLQTWTLHKILPRLAGNEAQTSGTARPHGERDLIVGAEGVPAHAGSEVLRSAAVSNVTVTGPEDGTGPCNSRAMKANGQGISNPFSSVSRLDGGAR